MLPDQVKFLPVLADQVAVNICHDTGKSRLDGIPAVLVDSPFVYLTCQQLRVGSAFGQQLHHLAVALRVNVRHIVADTDVTPLKRSIHLVLDVDGLFVQVEQPTVVLAELLDGKRRYEAASDKVLLQARGNPLGILHVALAARKLLDGKRIHQIKSEVTLKNTPDRHPVHCGALHGHLADTKFNQPVAERIQLNC